MSLRARSIPVLLMSFALPVASYAQDNLHLRMSVHEWRAPSPKQDERARALYEQRLRDDARRLEWSDARLQEEIQKLRNPAKEEPVVRDLTEELYVKGKKLLITATAKDPTSVVPYARAYDGENTTSLLQATLFRFRPHLELVVIDPPMLGFYLGSYPTIKIRSSKREGDLITYSGDIIAPHLATMPGESPKYTPGGAVAIVRDGLPDLQRIWLGEKDQPWETWLFDNYKQVGGYTLPTSIRFIHMSDSLKLWDITYNIAPELLPAPKDSDFDWHTFATAKAIFVHDMSQPGPSQRYPYDPSAKSFDEMRKKAGGQ